MDYEKKYKEALERARKLCTYPTTNFKSDLEDIFPELKESEDEKIRKALIRFHKSTIDIDGIKGEDIIAWLEKQGEQKHTIEMKSAEESLGIDSATYNKIVDEVIYGEQKLADKIEPKFKVGDWIVVSTAKGNKVAQIASVEYFKDGHPSYITTEGKWFGNGTKARLLTDKDVEITTIPESKAIVNKIKYWSEEDKMRLDRICKTLWKNRKGDTDEIYQQEQDIDWLKSFKERITNGKEN